MVRVRSRSAPVAASARTAYSSTTSPPFMSPAPIPRAMESWRTNVGPSGSTTVSKCPISSIRTAPARPRRSATRWPARRMPAGMSTHRVVNPSESRVARYTAPTRRTPSRLCVLLGMSTSRWR